MPERKFTDEQIIKALEHCTSSTTSEACNGCPFYDTDACIEMDNALNIYALDLINRQRAEIDDLTRDTIPKLKYGLERANKYGAELDKEFAELQRKYDLAVAEREANVKGFTATLKTIKTETIKEFAERFKGKMNNLSRMEYDCTPYFLVSKSFIDKITKEMTEGNDG